MLRTCFEVPGWNDKNNDFRFFGSASRQSRALVFLQVTLHLLRGSEGCLGSVAECSANLSMRAVECEALRVIPRGEQRLTVHRAQQVEESRSFDVGTFALKFSCSSFFIEK